MVCKVCEDMLYYHAGRIGQGSQLQLNFRHHVNLEHVRESADSCCLCRTISIKLGDVSVDDFQHGVFTNDHTFLTATLRIVNGSPGVYRLDFLAKKVEGTVASFVLERTDIRAGPELSGLSATNLSTSPAATVNTNPSISKSTGDVQVLAQAMRWVKDCVDNHGQCNHRMCDHEECKLHPEKPWHPTRLLDLKHMIDSNGSTKAVQLVSFKDKESRVGQSQPVDRYVTLSHCWGKGRFMKLSTETLDTFQDALLTKDLPPTFQHAIKVSRELGVRWLWIDAMCILQGDEDDWLQESARMHMVYTHSYCNISATAAMDSLGGLFRDRLPPNTWVENVTLNTSDLEGASQVPVSCAVLDLSFWADTVDHAPANKRSWVFQERLLAPRVLHWCQDQIAFECRQEEIAECRPQELPNYQISGGQLIDGARLKRFDKDTGINLRRTRLSSEQTDSWELAEEKLYFYELWKRAVEVYTKMEITDHRDRLIALSGIARMMTSTLASNGIKDQYIAGMWENYMASHLLWYVNEGNDNDKQPYEDTRPKDRKDPTKDIYRAPSFSWASVETNRGITFGETMDTVYSDTSPKGLLIEVEGVRLIYRKRDDMFGLLIDGYLIVRGVLRKIELTDAWANEPERIPEKIRDTLPEEEPNPAYSPNWRILISHGKQILMQYWTMFTLWVLFCWAASNASLQNRVFQRRSFPQTLRPKPPMNLTEKAVQILPTKTPQSNAERKGLRYSWRLSKDGKSEGDKFETIYLDSPKSEPSIFGQNGNVFLLPAAIDDRRLTCIIVQAAGGDYGMRYKRVGLTTIQTIYADVEDIKTPAGNRKIDEGRYWWGTGRKPGERGTVCII